MSNKKPYIPVDSLDQEAISHRKPQVVAPEQLKEGFIYDYEQAAPGAGLYAVHQGEDGELRMAVGRRSTLHGHKIGRLQLTGAGFVELETLQPNQVQPAWETALREFGEEWGVIIPDSVTPENKNGIVDYQRLFEIFGVADYEDPSEVLRRRAIVVDGIIDTRPQENGDVKHVATMVYALAVSDEQRAMLEAHAPNSVEHEDIHWLTQQEIAEEADKFAFEVDQELVYNTLGRVRQAQHDLGQAMMLGQAIKEVKDLSEDEVRALADTYRNAGQEAYAEKLIEAYTNYQVHRIDLSATHESELQA